MSNHHSGKKLCMQFIMNTIQHLGNHPEWLKTHQNHSSFCDRFKIMVEDRDYYHTVMLHIFRDGQFYIYHGITQNQSLTPSEAARLQTFPNDYFFESVSEKPGYTAAYYQIRNAVPDLLPQKISEKLHEVW
jgi:DNA (cytosine-5)-methyltransferase 1